MNPRTEPGHKPSIVHGTPLSEEIGQKAQTIAGFAKEITTRFAERDAVVAHTPAGRVCWTYADLWEHSVAIARSLVACGVGKDSRVGILMTNRPEFVASVFGIALAGGVSVAFNTFATSSELDELLRISGVHMLLFEQQVAKKDFGAALSELEPAIAVAELGKLASTRYPFLRHLAMVDTGASNNISGVRDWQDFLQLGDSTPADIVEARAGSTVASDAAVLFFSSGSTGRPKGILHTQRAVAIQWWRWPRMLALSGDLRVWNANGFFWSGNFSMAIGTALATGGTLILQSVFDAEDALELMQRERVNVPMAMPHQWGRMGEAANFERADLSGLRFLDTRFAGIQHPSVSTQYRTPQAFGCTETLTINTMIPTNETGETRFEGHGLPLPGNTLKIVDSLTGAIVPRGQRGEIAVKGPTLMMSYLGKPLEASLDGEGFYHTGDGGYVDDDGWLFWEGRLTDIIKTGGANVSPVEVDEVIQTCPGIKATQTVGVPHDTLGEIVVACVVPHRGASISESTVQAFVKERLASYKIPRRVLILGEDELSVTGSGTKIRAAMVRELAVARLNVKGANR